MLMVLSVVGLLELRYLRNRRKRREPLEELPDRAHNAILTTKAIAEALGRGGVRSPEADDLLREAESAGRERNYRVAIDLAERAKGILRTAKKRQQQAGDLAKVGDIGKGKSGASDEMTSEERLTKEMPPNFVPSRFTINLAHDDIAAAKARGQDTSPAERHLADAQAMFDGADYDGALRGAVRARRSLEPNASEPPSQTAPAGTSTAKARSCASCGAVLGATDTFCRTCGVKVAGPKVCA